MEIEKIHSGSFNSNKVISVSLFRMLKGKFNSMKYYINLIKFVKMINKYLPDFKIILYIDLSVTTNHDGTKYKFGMNMLQEFKNNNKLDILLFNDERFKINKYYHDGTYGSLVRLLPFFENKYKIVWHSDIDLREDTLKDLIKQYKKFIKTDAKVLVINKDCYPKLWIDKKNKFSIINYCIISKVSFDNSLKTFLSDIEKNKNSKIIKNISKGRRTLIKETRMPYGIDELFTNKYFYKFIMKNKIKTMVYTVPSVERWLRKLYYLNISKNKEMVKSDLLKFIKYVNKNRTKLAKKFPEVIKGYFNICPNKFLKYDINKSRVDFVN